MKDFKSYKLNELVLPKIPMVGIPSGEYIELTADQFKDLNQARLLLYDTSMGSMTFRDKDYSRILHYISDIQKEKIKSFLKSIGLEKYRINDDYTVEALENVKIRKEMSHLPIQFDYAMGHFDISDCGLTTLQGCPETVEGDFLCTNNDLRDLKMGPQKVNGNYDVRECNLSSLTGAPVRLKKNFLCSKNNLRNLNGGPRIVDGSYYTDNCLLISLEGSPDLLVGNFDCSFNLLQSLEDGPDMMDGTYNCSNNNLKTLKYGPTSVGIFKCNGNRDLRDLSNGPQASKTISDEI